MAAPIIDSVVPSSASLVPGEFVDVVVEAHDPDSASGSVDFPVTDSQGNTVTASVSLVLNDPLSFGAALNPSGLAVTVTKIAEGPHPVTGNPSATYRVQA